MLSKTGQDVLSGVQIGHKDSSPVRTHRKKPHDSAVQAAATSDFRLLCIRFGHKLPLQEPGEAQALSSTATSIRFWSGSRT